MDSEPTTSGVGLPAILVVTCSSSNSGSSNSGSNNSIRRHLSAVEENAIVTLEAEAKTPISTGSTKKTVVDDSPVHCQSDSGAAAAAAESATEVAVKTFVDQPATRETELRHVHSMVKAPPPAPSAPPPKCPASTVSVKFCAQAMPRMSGKDPVRYLSHFRLGDTYKLKSRNWLLPQFLSGVLTLVGVVLTLVGIISLQINKYLHACDADDGVDCQSNKATINNIMMPIGVGSTGGGLSLILISGFIFVHAFCVIYEDGENEDEDGQDGVLHIPTSQRAALLGSSSALAAEASLARCHSYYDNLEYHVAL